MAIKLMYLPVDHAEAPVIDLVGQYNNPHIPAGILEKLVDEFDVVNEDMKGTIYVPILTPFQKKYENLLTADQAIDARAGILPPGPVVDAEAKPEEPTEEPEVEPEPEIVKPEVRAREIIESGGTAKPKPTPGHVAKTAPRTVPEQPVKTVGNIKYRTFPYTFSRPNETIEAIIRLFNDMSVSRPVINKLVFEFTKINKEAQPPKLGQTVDVPVLLPFVYRHVNENKIFTDE